nr:MAG TPA: hypothetical protein [Bacteriophage sp.]
MKRILMISEQHMLTLWQELGMDLLHSTMDNSTIQRADIQILTKRIKIIMV